MNEFDIGTRPQGEWGWLVIFDLFFTSAGAGSFVFALILGFLLHMIIGVTLVLLGAFFLLADLSRPIVAWRAIMRPRTSWISRGAIGVMVFLGLSIIYIIILWIRQESLTSTAGLLWTTGPGWLVTLGAMAGCTALFVVAYPGFLLASMRSVMLWNTTLLPTLNLLSGLLCGLGVIYLIPYRGQEAIANLILLRKMGLGMIILGIFMIVSLAKVERADINAEAISLFTGGSHWLFYMIAILGVGLILPLIILVLELTGIESALLLPFAGIFLILGMLLLRYVIIQAGMHRRPI
jgi:formate-dependent nitrite reductase membrane component NrfD